ncbi:hypothetical protein CY35_12G014000 [Sphagnum magellanicum]|nr:hypothetical protein CY35_12G014000 [Sphagnum magellanicum]
MASRWSSLLRYFSSTRGSSGPVAVWVGYAPGAGRGVFAVLDIAVGDLIRTADPVVAHPALASLQKACYYCLQGIKKQQNTRRLLPVTMGSANIGRTSTKLSPDDETGHAGMLCSTSCEDSAAKVFYSIEKQADWSQLHAYCTTHGLLIPLVAKRLACMVASSATSEHVLDILTHMNLSQGIIPEENASVLTEDWYAGITARLHLNAFCVERIDELDAEDLLAAATASITGDSILDSNVNILFLNNVTANVLAHRDITAGEDLCITYIHANMPCNARRSVLQQAYGFVRECERCREGD